VSAIIGYTKKIERSSRTERQLTSSIIGYAKNIRRERIISELHRGHRTFVEDTIFERSNDHKTPGNSKRDPAQRNMR
jgi:hypothetical protein